MNHKVAVIIPCYNQGHFLSDALMSLKECDASQFEILIVNDGSTDAFTKDYLDKLSKEGYRIIHQENKGLSGARNTGINAVTAEYVLMLDADNKVRPSYIPSALPLFEKNENVAVVYGDGEYFGDRKGIRKQGSFNLQKQMLVNYIDACAIIRRSVLLELGGYDENMKTGWEDWEMWLRIAFKGYTFAYIPAVVFDYRVRQDSMAKNVYANKARTNAIENYVYRKYPDKMGMNYVVDFLIERFRRNPLFFITKLFIRAYFPSTYDKLIKENKIRNGL